MQKARVGNLGLFAETSVDFILGVTYTFGEGTGHQYVKRLNFNPVKRAKN